MKKCPFCAEEIQDEAIVCRYCGRELTKPVAPPQPATPPQPTKSSLEQQTKKTKRTGMTLVSGLIGLCVFFICIIAVMRVFGGTTTTQEHPTSTAKPSSVVILPPTSTNEPSATNTPKPTNTPRPTATPAYGSFDNPYPYAVEAPLTFTSRGQKSDFTLQVVRVIRGPDANSMAKTANMFNDDPPAGASWMFVQVKVTLTDGAAFKLSDSNLAVISGGQIFSGFDFSVCCTDDIGFPKLDASIAVPGTSVEGWVVRPVILTDAEPMLALGLNSFQPDLNDGVYLSLRE